MMIKNVNKHIVGKVFIYVVSMISFCVVSNSKAMNDGQAEKENFGVGTEQKGNLPSRHEQGLTVIEPNTMQPESVVLKKRLINIKDFTVLNRRLTDIKDFLELARYTATFDPNYMTNVQRAFVKLKDEFYKNKANHNLYNFYIYNLYMEAIYDIIFVGIKSYCYDITIEALTLLQNVFEEIHAKGLEFNDTSYKSLKESYINRINNVLGLDYIRVIWKAYRKSNMYVAAQRDKENSVYCKSFYDFLQITLISLKLVSIQKPIEKKHFNFAEYIYGVAKIAVRAREGDKQKNNTIFNQIESEYQTIQNNVASAAKQQSLSNSNQGDSSTPQSADSDSNNDSPTTSQQASNGAQDDDSNQDSLDVNDTEYDSQTNAMSVNMQDNNEEESGIESEDYQNKVKAFGLEILKARS